MIADYKLMGVSRKNCMENQREMLYRVYLKYKLVCMRDSYSSYVETHWSTRHDVEDYKEWEKAWVKALDIVEKQIASNKAMDKEEELKGEYDD